MSQNHDLTTGPISRHFRILAIPTAIGMIFTTLYNVVDVYFAGLLSTDAQAGLAISFTVFFLLITVGFGLSSALSALVGNALGAKDAPGAKRMACQGISFAVVASIVVLILGFFITPFLIDLISEPGAYRDAAKRYLLILLLSVPGFVVGFGANGILTAQGDTVSMQRAQIAAFFANLVLNPIFIFGIPGLIGGIGFDGIALSTVISQTGTMVWIFYRIFRSDVMTAPHEPGYAPNATDYRTIMAQAAPSAFAMAVMMIAGFVIQFFLKDFGGSAVAAYGVALRIEQLLLLPAFGLTGALLPIAAQNYGAGQFDRVREAVKFCFKFGVGMMLVASLILWLAGGFAMSLFSDDADVISVGRSYLAVDGFILPIYVMLFAINSLLQALKKPVWTLWIGIYRQGFGVAFFGYIFVAIFGMGVWGVWIGIAVSVLTGFALSLFVIERVAGQLIGGLFRRQPKSVE